MMPSDDGAPGISVIVTNLTAQKRNEQIVASERLARSILDQSVEAVIVCNEAGIVMRASRPAQEIATGAALHQSVLTAFPLQTALHPAALALEGKVTVGVEHVLDVPGRGEICVLCTAAPLVDEKKAILGCVLSLLDITQRKQAEAERLELLDAERAARALAERARVEAETSNRSKDEFLATVSHELRTPLNAIVGWARLLSDGRLSPDQQRQGLEVIRRNADAQALLIEDLLDVSRIISGKMRIETLPVDPRAVIEAVLESVRPAVEAKQLRLERVYEIESPMIVGDESRLRQIVWNLVSNAVKFTPSKGEIRIALRSDGGAVDIVVTDNGRGITADFLPYVFDRFRQADGGINRAHGGLGLGLAISRHLAELHGGRIEVASDGADAGSTFTLRLPARQDLPVSRESASTSPSSAPVRAPSFELTDLHGIRVLVVEDDQDSRDLLVDILSSCGADVRATDSGHEALELLGHAASDVLISDVGMPLMNGYELIRRVRGLDDLRLQKIPALALTAYARAEDRRRALLEGFQMHLSKPVDPSELAVIVSNLVRR
jgi:signal transduction histidine kinase